RYRLFWEKQHMRRIPFAPENLKSRKAKAKLLLLAGSALVVTGLWAQQKGPLPPPKQGVAAPANAPVTGAANASPSRQQPSSHITSAPPAMPVDQIIQKFAAREEEFKKERDNYTYTQTLVVQSLDLDGNPNGEFRLTSDILFTPEGKRYDKVLYAPQGTLQGFDMDQQDMEDLQHVQPFVLTTGELPKYDINYVG